MLPEGWKKEKLKNVSVITTGNTPSPKNKEYYGGNIPFVSPSDLGIGKYVFKTNKYLSQKGAEVSRVVRAGSSLFTCIGSTVGKISIAGKDVVTNQQINSVSPHDRLNDDFAFYYLDFISDEISLLAGTQALPIINKSTFSGITINLPPLPEQKKIAAILSTWDRAIEGTEKLLANSQQQKKALMQQLLTGKKRLPGFTGEWFHLPFKKVAEIIYGKALPEKPPAHNTVYPVYGTGGIISYSNEYLFEGPSIIIGRKGTIDTPRYVNTPFWCIDTTFYCKSIHNNDVKFLYYSICFVKLRRYVEASGVPSLSRDTIYSIPLMLPPSLSEQKAIAAVLTTADEEITALESDLCRLRQEKKALMQQLLTGKRRVKVD